jgi:hypothetical protein
MFVEIPRDMDADTLVAEKIVADAEYQRCAHKITTCYIEDHSER